MLKQTEKKLSRNSLFKLLAITIVGCSLIATNPQYSQHELIVSEICQQKSSQNNVLVCPLGYGNKNKTEFKRDSFSVYNIGILSYSTYEKKIASIGFFGNVFLSPNFTKV